MRSVDELIEFMDWPGDVNYEELMEQKRKYVYDEHGEVRAKAVPQKVNAKGLSVSKTESVFFKTGYIFIKKKKLQFTKSVLALM